jgi:hypothetical protein
LLLLLFSFSGRLASALNEKKTRFFFKDLKKMKRKKKKKKAKPSLYGLSRQGLASSVCVMEWRGEEGGNP